MIKRLLDTVTRNTLRCLDSQVIELNSFEELKKLYRWQQDPIIDRPHVGEVDYVEDVNQRRLRDAESVATVIRNIQPRVTLEIGTGEGLGTILMSVNAPQSAIYTVNIAPDEIVAGKGGKLTTIALERERIGSAYRARGLQNITQILANTATWTPDIGAIDLAFIDGCHDSEFVYNDTRKVLRHMTPGGFVLWHDFNPALARKFPWIHSVCSGVEKLYREGLINGRIFLIRDSWVGIYQVPK